MSPLLSLLAACTAPVSDYTLRISPNLLDDQRSAVLGFDPDVFVQIVSPGGEETLRYVGAAADGVALALPNLPPIDAGSTVALILSHPGGPTDRWERERTIAYGSALVEEDLALGKSELTLEIEVRRVDDVGKLGALKGSSRKLGGALAAVPGAVYLFGGGDPATDDRLDSPGLGNPRLISSDTVMKATVENGVWSELEEVGKIEPFVSQLSFLGEPAEVPGDRRAGMTATPVNTQGEDAILVVGGRYTEFPEYFTAGWFVWSPASDSIIASGELLYERSDHLALPLGTNKVLVFGGQLPVAAGGIPYYELWLGQERDSDYDSGGNNDLLDLGGFAAMGTSIDGEAIVCGGYRVDTLRTEGNVWVAQTGCHRFKSNGSRVPIADLPNGIGLGGGALAPLPDGGLLLTGGTSADLIEETEGQTVIIGSAVPEPALDTAYRYDLATDSWRSVGRLVYARANHRMVPLSGGKILVVGGTESMAPYLSDLGQARNCTEIFDPGTDTFTASTCTEAGQGAYPEVASDGLSQVAVFEGKSGEIDPTGGGSYGVIGLLPP